MPSFKADLADFVIVLMGPTGSGKTNFINNVTGNAAQRKASNLKSDTRDVTPYTISRHNGRRVVLVDTPGFDDTRRPDSDILKTVSDWLIQRYNTGGTAELELAGIVYLHRITDNPTSCSAYKNLQMFGKLCGDIPLRRAHLVTTMWDIVKDKNGAERREAELTRDVWRQLLQEGAKASKFDNRSSSAWTIVESLLQEEPFKQKDARLNETVAADELRPRPQQLQAEQKKTLEEQADRMDVCSDPASARRLQGEHEPTKAQFQKASDHSEPREKETLTGRIFQWLGWK